MGIPAVGDKITIFDRHNGFTALTASGTLWRPRRVLSKVAPEATEMTVTGICRNMFYQTTQPVVWVTCKIKGYPYEVRAYFNEETGERIA